LKKTLGVVWLNEYSSLKLIREGLVILVDPCQIPSSSIEHADYILISHEHFDHLDIGLIKEIYRKSFSMILADTESSSRLKSYFPREHLRTMRPSDLYKDSKITVRAYKSIHPAVNPVTYLIEYPDGMKVYYAGDSLVAGEHSQIAKSDIDVAFIPVGIAPGASPKSGSEMVHVVQPKIAIPFHGTRLKDFKSLVEVRDPKVIVQIIPKDVEVVIEI